MILFKTKLEHHISGQIKVCLHVALLCGLVHFCGAAQSSPGEFSSVDMSKVKVGGEIGRRIDLTIYNNLLVLDVERDFLSPFREPHDKPREHPDNYFGLGKLIDASVKFAYYSGDEKVFAFKNHLISEVIQCQLEDGYIGAFRPEDRLKMAWDGHELVYLIYGLTSDYHYFHHQKSLDAAVKLARYLMEHRPVEAYHGTEIGQEEAFVALYEATNNQEYLTYLEKNGFLTLDPTVREGGPDSHSYTQMSRSLAQIELYTLTQDPSLLNMAHNIVKFLTGQDGMLINGSCSLGECWHSNQAGYGVETCATACEIKLFNKLIQLEGNSLYGDIMERAIYNALFAAQSPDGRHVRYYTSVEGRRAYYYRDTYCCPCNFRRIMAELPGMIYYKTDKGVAINLYTASQAGMALNNGLKLKISQETDYPSSGNVLVRLEPARAAEFPVLLRIPRWCHEVKIAVNGAYIDDAIMPGTFFELARKWKRGDEIRLEMAMDWRFVKGRKVNEGLVAVMRGPSLFCLAQHRIRQSHQCDYNDAGPMFIKPDTIKEPYADNSYRPGGLVGEVGGMRQGEGDFRDITMPLTEYMDPAGEMVFFKPIEPATIAPVDDELMVK